MHFKVENLHVRCDSNVMHELVADNDGYYVVSFEFDSTWEGLNKTARFICDDGYYDSLIRTDNTCVVPDEVLHCTGILKLGVYAGVYGESLLTTTTACMRIINSVFTDSGSELPPKPADDIYLQILGMSTDARDIAQSVREDADSGKFNGKDYILTVADKQEIAGIVATEIINPLEAIIDESGVLQ